MRQEKTVVTIFGSDDSQTQDIEVSYDIEWHYEWAGEWWNRIFYTLFNVKVLTVVTIEPENLYEDVMNGIAFGEDRPSSRFSFEGEIEVVISAEESVNH